MLALTDSAKDAVRQMVSAEEAPEGSGLRIAAEPAEGGDAALSLELTTEPAEGDEVVEEDGARVFLDPMAATLLDDKVLDATEHEDHVHLTVQEQGSDPGANGSVTG
jgi:Fe-S cluster assembly iron-binding protein IscA